MFGSKNSFWKSLPPLNALRFFEAAARHLSFKEAAEELGITQSAVSYQISRLEEDLEALLFIRLNRSLKLTESGQEFLMEVRPALQRLASAADRLRSTREEKGVLSVSIMPSFAMKCLLPALSQYRSRFPKLDLRMSTTYEAVRPGANGIDCCIRFGEGRGEGTIELLGEEVLYPVCSPRFLEIHRKLETPQDLLSVPLLHDVGTLTWSDWLSRHDIKGPLPEGPVFTDSSLLLQAAIDGEGVALGRSVLVDNDINAGRLVPVFSPERVAPITGRDRYWFVCQAGEDRAHIFRFRDWLKERFFPPIGT